jgi:RND superfamily putative drug exporter
VVFARLGSWCHRRKWLVVGLWFATLIVAGTFSGVVGSSYSDDFNLPSVESKTGIDLLQQRFGGQGAGYTGTIVYQAPQGVDDPSVRTPMSALFAEVARIDGVGRVSSPYTEAGAHQIASDGPESGKIAYAEVELPKGTSTKKATEIRDAIKRFIPKVAGMRVELGGQVFGEFETPSTEAIGIGFAVFILILAFGSVLAMGLPIGVALFGIGLGSVLIGLMSNVIGMPNIASFIAIMIGLGVGIDYALLIVTRYREQIHAGHSGNEATAIALDTAGRSVLFAGTTVVISMLGMLVMNVDFITGLAVSAAAVVAVTVVASLTLLPALLGLAGDRTERTRWRGLIAASFVAVALILSGFGITAGFVGIPIAALVIVVGLFSKKLKQEVPRRAPKPRRETLAYRWSRGIQHRPWVATLSAVAILLVLAVPTLGLRLGSADESNFQHDTSTYKAYSLLVAGFGKGFNGPFVLAAPLPKGIDTTRLDAVTDAVKADPGVVFVSPVSLNDPEHPTAASWTVVPSTGPQDKATSQLVHRLRKHVLPPAAKAAGVSVYVTGNVAVQVDFASYLGARMPLFLGAVLLLSFLLLLLVFRSLLVPLKAVVMNLLSIAAAYGIVVALFQWGWFSDLTHVQPAPIESWGPMMLFAIVFGLSMDYEVFLLSRVREEWHRTGDSHRSVADGLAATAKVITAAAAIMVVVFGSFLLEKDRAVKMMGTGLAVAILLDATIVRMLLVPATMELLGDRNWWLPRWLDRILPSIDVEGQATSVFEDEDEEPELQPV